MNEQDIGHGHDSGVGALLRASRLRCGEELPDVAAMLRIRYPYLEAIEDGRYQDLPGATYAVGFVRTYAEHLGLDADEVVRRFKAETENMSRRTALVFPSPIAESSTPGGAIVFIGILVAAIAYGAWYIGTSKNSLIKDLVSPLPDRLAALVSGDSSSETGPTVTTPPAVQPPATTAPAPAATAPTTVVPPAEETPAAETSEPAEPAPVTATAPTQMPTETETPPAETPPAETPPAESTQPAPAVEPEPQPPAAAPEPAPVEPVEAAAPPPATETPAEPAAVTPPEMAVGPETSAPAEPAEPAAEAQPASPPAEEPAPQVAEAPRVETPAPAVEPEPQPAAAAPEPAPAETAAPTEPEPAQAAPAETETPAEAAAESPAAAPPAPAPQPPTPAPAASPPPVPSAPSEQVAAIPAAPETAAETAPQGRVFGATNESASQIVVKARQDAWIQVRDGIERRLLVTRLLRAGDSYRVPNRPGLTLLTGNAGALEILVDGKPVPSIGGAGAVRRNVSLDPEKLKAGEAVLD